MSRSIPPARSLVASVALVFTIGTNFLQAAPLIIAQPTSKQAFVGGTSNVNFAVLATGAPSPNYQWKLLTSGSAATPIPGATNSVYTLSGTMSLGMNGNQYQCVVTSGSATVASNPATLNVYSAPTVTPVVTVTPGTIAASSTSTITIHVTGLKSGDSVRIDRFLDANGNGKPDVGEPLVQSFLVADGVVPSIGGVPDLNIIGDHDGVQNGQVSVLLTLPTSPEVAQSSGSYLIAVSSPTGEFKPVTAPLTITQPAYAQSISGQVLDPGSAPIPYAAVVLLTNDGDGKYVASAVSDASGRYTLNAAAGSYMMMGVHAGYVASFGSAPTPTLQSGQTLTGVNPVLTPATCTISGQAQNAVNQRPVRGVQLFLQSKGNNVVVANSDSDGNYDAASVADQWGFEISDKSLTPLGYIGKHSSLSVDTTGGSMAGENLPLNPIDALVYGTLKDSQNNAVAGIAIDVDDNANDSAQTVTDAGGNYALGIISGTSWWVGPDNSVTLPGYILPNGQNFTPVSGSATQINLVAQKASSYLQGTVTVNGTAASGVVIDFYQQNGPNGNGGQFTTGSNGSFNLPVTTGTWTISLDNSGAGNGSLVGPSLSEIVSGSGTITGIAFNALAASATISGIVTDSGSNALGNVNVNAWAIINGVNYSAGAQTGSNGNYSLPVISGTWTLNVFTSGQQLNFSQQTALVTGSGNVTLNFAAAGPQADASLASLTLSSGTLSPTFSSMNTFYNANVLNSTSSITVTPVASNTAATVQVEVNSSSFQSTPSGSPSAALPLNVGSNAVNLQVLAADGTTTMTYNINVDRAAPSIAPVLSFVANEGGAPPGITGTAPKFLAFGSPAINNVGHCAFQATIAGSGLGTANNSGIWSQNADSTRLIVSTGTAPAGKSPLLALGDPVLNNLDQVAFIGTLKGAKGIWSNANLSGALQLVAQTGGAVPDATGTNAIPKAKFLSFSQVVLPDEGGVAFLATLSGAAATMNSTTGVTTAPSEGIWAVDTNGVLKRVVGKGDAVTLAGVEYTITALNIFSSTAGTTAQTRSFNSRGDLTYQVTLQNLKAKRIIHAIQTVVFP